MNDARLEPGLFWAAYGRILFGCREDPMSDRSDQSVRCIRVDQDTGKAAGQPQFVTNGAGAGKASVVLEGATNTEFWWMIPSPAGRHGILGVEVPGDNTVWMVDKF